MARMVISSSCSGTSSAKTEGGRAMELMCCRAMDTGVSPSKGRRPVIISYITTPREYRSVRLST